MADHFAPELLLCVMQRKHAMVTFVPALDGYRGPRWGRTFHLRCVNCRTERHVTINSLGDIDTQRYIRTPQYEAALKSARDLGTGDRRLEYVASMKRQARARREKTA